MGLNWLLASQPVSWIGQFLARPPTFLANFTSFEKDEVSKHSAAKKSETPEAFSRS
jgi:hypothetical protein